MQKDETKKKSVKSAKGDEHPTDPTVPNRAHTEMKSDTGETACMKNGKQKKG